MIRAMDSTRPHRKLVKHYHEPGDLHELTFSCYHRLPLLTNDDWRRRLARSIDEANQQESMRLAAFVFKRQYAQIRIGDSSHVSRKMRSNAW